MLIHAAPVGEQVIEHIGATEDHMKRFAMCVVAEDDTTLDNIKT